MPPPKYNPGCSLKTQLALQRCILYNRPKRNTVIQDDEIINLVILLNTTKSVNEFLEKFLNESNT